MVRAALSLAALAAALTLSLLALDVSPRLLSEAEPRALQALVDLTPVETGLTGPFATLMKPDEMQPIYMLPLTNGVKQLVTFYVFGFDFKTKFKRGTCVKKMFFFCVSYVAKLAFIFLSINSYVSDVRKFQSRQAHDLDSPRQSALIFLAVWCTSHNFSASLGLWGSFTIQSPAVIFEKDIADPRYFPARSCWGFGKVQFPFFLGGARWLQFPKQVYALILLPYIVPYMLLSYFTVVLLCGWSFLYTKCCCLVKCLWLYLALIICGVMYLFGARQTGLQEAWERMWPFFYLMGVQIYATYIVPPFIAILFGILSGSSPGAIRRGLGMCKHETDEFVGRGDPMLESCGNIQQEIYHEMEEARKEWTEDVEEDHCQSCAPCWIRLEACCKFTAWLVPQRDVRIAEDDRVTLLRLNWGGLSSDFKFNSECMGQLSKWRDELDLVTDDLEDFSPFDESSDSEEEDSCPTPYGKGLVDLCVGRELLLDYDPHEKHAPTLRSQLNNETDDNTIDDALIQVVLVTIREISQIALQQALTIWLIRTLATSDFEGMVEAMRQTVTERTFQSYAQHLATLGEQKLQQALNTVWGL